MSFNSTDFTPVSLNVIQSGIVIDFSIYREKNGEFSLLGKDIVMTADVIEKFKRLTYPDFNIFIPNDKYKYVVNAVNRPPPKVKKNPFIESYEQLKDGASKMLENIASSDSVPVEVVEELTQSVHKQVETAEISHIIQSINSVRKVDEYLHTHCVNVALLNGVMGRWLKYSKQSLAALVKVGLLHDIGKIKISQEILNKPTRLNEEEFDLVMNHPIFSHELMVRSGFTDERILKGVIQHHERVNGMGYPFGSGISNITEFAKITSISDVYDAMVTTRAYKDAHSPFEILSWFSDGCYSELDYNFVSVFIESMAEELKGKKVLLSNGKTGTVMFVYSMNIGYPIVESEGKIVNTNANLKCVSVLDEDY
ncbi:MAG: HD domain-containing protein [Oscillospiraceae bacterium]|nr:HD domain-containing protein [Oscillospiraceae bacterium]